MSLRLLTLILFPLILSTSALQSSQETKAQDQIQKNQYTIDGSKRLIPLPRINDRGLYLQLTVGSRDVEILNEYDKGILWTYKDILKEKLQENSPINLNITEYHRHPIFHEMLCEMGIKPPHQISIMSYDGLFSPEKKIFAIDVDFIQDLAHKYDAATASKESKATAQGQQS